jgi:hypothetical protein
MVSNEDARPGGKRFLHHIEKPASERPEQRDFIND